MRLLSRPEPVYLYGAADQQYLSRISKPLLDRIDICAEAVPMKYEELKGRGEGEPSSAIRERVEAARIIQRQRLESSGIYFNSAMNGAQIRSISAVWIRRTGVFKTYL